MIGKNNKKLKELKQGVKVESYSIKKFKFGAASIVIGASIFFGTGVASANEVAASSDSSATNDTNATSGNGDKIPEKINTVSAEKESVTSVNKPSSVKEESTKVEVEKKVVDKSLLETSITKLEELLATVNKDKAPASTLSAVNVDLINAKSILENANASQEEVDALVKKLKQQTQIVSSMPKVTTKEKEVKEGANTIANSGSRDSRNGQSMGEGTGGRAATVSSKWTNQDNLLSYQRFYGSDGSGNIRNNDRKFVEEKVDMTARIQTIDGQRYVVYDVFFNNDGKDLADAGIRQAYRLLLQPKILDLQTDGRYKSDTIRDLYFEIYRKNNQNEGGLLSQNPEKFHYERTVNLHFLNDAEKTQHGFAYLNTVGVRAGRSHADDMNQVFKANRTNPDLEKAVKLEGKYSGWSYGLGLRTTDKTAAVHMHLKAKLRPGVTDEDVRQAFTIAVASNYAPTSHKAYAFVSGKEFNENVEPTVKQSTKYPIIGKEVTKKVDEPLGNLNNPVESGFVTRNDGSKNFPNNMSWSWPNGQPNTGTAGVFQRQVKATYSDNSSNTTTATLKVIPNKPTIDQNSVNEKG